jgi:ABC-type uncharacterized transport system permease subunit
MGVASAFVFYVVDPETIIDALRSGYFDTYLTKPYEPVLFLFERQPSPWNFFYVMSYAALLVFAVIHMPVTAASVLLSIVLIAAGLAALCTVALFLDVLSYKLFARAKWLEKLINLASSAGQYPLGVFGNIGAFALTIVVPVGLAVFYPASFLFHGLSVMSALSLLVLDAAFIAVFYKLTLHLLKGYTSAMG